MNIKYLIAAGVVALVAAITLFPNTMIAPGKLMAGHEAIERDCFTCHTPLLGVSSDKCTSCHSVADIGTLTTTKKPIQPPADKSKTRVAFHHKLLNPNCTACHSDHAGPLRLRPQGQFKHALLDAATQKQCTACHTAPTDSLHQQITGNCMQCHSQERWKPATFEHTKYFELDRDHNVKCATCHVNNDYKTATCYGCHEHTVSNIKRKHEKEGISQFDRCAKCHRNANEDDAKRENGGSKRDD